jgi:hypothetical protein
LPCIGPQRREVGIISAADDSAAAAVGTDPFSLPLLRMGLLLPVLLLLSLDAFLLFATCARSVSMGRTLGDGPGCALDVGRTIEDLGESCVGKNGPEEEARAGFASLVPSGWRTGRGRLRHRRLTTESLANMMRRILSGGQTGGKETKGSL